MYSAIPLVCFTKARPTEI